MLAVKFWTDTQSIPIQMSIVCGGLREVCHEMKQEESLDGMYVINLVMIESFK